MAASLDLLRKIFGDDAKWVDIIMEERISAVNKAYVKEGQEKLGLDQEAFLKQRNEKKK
jgi:hypothetical protein